jgi:hypothetical protein
MLCSTPLGRRAVGGRTPTLIPPQPWRPSRSALAPPHRAPRVCRSLLVANAVQVSAVNGSGAGPSSSLSTASDVSAGGQSACAVLASGGVDCWGSDMSGQLGDGVENVGSGTPVEVTGITNASSVSVGESSACAVLTTGAINCWGRGPLGNGTYGSDTPVQVSGIANASSVSVGAGSACAVLASSAIDCWGNNASGDLGDGGTSPSATPVLRWTGFRGDRVLWIRRCLSRVGEIRESVQRRRPRRGRTPPRRSRIPS